MADSDNFFDEFSPEEKVASEETLAMSEPFALAKLSLPGVFFTSTLLEELGKLIYIESVESFNVFNSLFSGEVSPNDIDFYKHMQVLFSAATTITMVIQHSDPQSHSILEMRYLEQAQRTYFEMISRVNGFAGAILNERFKSQSLDSDNEISEDELPAISESPVSINKLFENGLKTLVDAIPDTIDYIRVPETAEYQIDIEGMRRVSDNYEAFLAKIRNNPDIKIAREVPYFTRDKSNPGLVSTLGVAGWLDKLYGDIKDIRFMYKHPALYRAIWDNDDRSGLLLLAVNSADNSFQAKVYYYFLCKIVTDVIIADANETLSTWYQANQDLIYFNNSPGNHDSKPRAINNPNYRLATDVDGTPLDMNGFVNLWITRLDELNDVLLGRSDFKDWHHDWIEWLAHMVNVGGGNHPLLEGRKTIVKMINEFQG